MSYIKTETLTLPMDKQVQVRMKRALSYGDWKAGMDFYRDYSFPPADAGGDAETATLKRQLAETQRNVETSRIVLTRVIVDWTLTDADDQPIPVSRAGLEELQKEDLDFLMQKATGLFGSSRRPAEAEVPFGKRSGKHSKATRSPSRPSSKSTSS